MHATLPDSEVPSARLFLRVYEDGPYLVTRMIVALYHIIPLPESLDDSSLRSLARAQHQCNQLPTWLVLGTRSGIYFDRHGTETVTEHVPSDGFFDFNRLKPCAPLEHTPWWDAKITRLQAVAEQLTAERRPLLLIGNPNKGGRPATFEELQRFAGTNPEGIPTGLSRCSVCAEWNGTCLDPAPLFHGQLMPVACRCENDNRCARCHQLLAGHKLNTNYYRGSDGHVWHCPGVVGLIHRCSSQYLASADNAPEVSSGWTYSHYP